MPHKNVARKSAGNLVFTLLVWAGLVLAVAAKEQGLQTEANVMVELTLRSNRSYADPFNDVALDVTFIHPRGREQIGRASCRERV